MSARGYITKASTPLDDACKQIDEGFAQMRADQDETHKWISDIEARMNSTRFGRLGPGDNGLAAIPPQYRKHIDLAEKLGYGDPIKTAGCGFWWQMMILAKEAAKNPTGTPPHTFIEAADKWERSMGFDPEEKHRLYSIQKGAIGEGAGGGGNIIALPVEVEL